MRIASGRIVGGKVEIEGDPPAEGAVVTVLVREDGETFELSVEEEVALLSAIDEAERGVLIDGDELLRSLRS
jgi:hypothetical protein